MIEEYPALSPLELELIELLDEHFPKGVAKERGQAMVFLALAIPRIHEYYKKEAKEVKMGSNVKCKKV